MNTLRDEEIVERLRRMARDDTAGSVPWPAVTTVVRRSRQRRALAAAGALAAVGIAAAGITALQNGSVRSEQAAQHSVPPSPEPSVSNSLGPYPGTRRPGAKVPPPPAGIVPAAGSLAADEELISTLRQRIADRYHADGPQQVHVLWAGVVDGRRLAVTAAPGPDAMGMGDMRWKLDGWRLDGDLRQIDGSMEFETPPDLRTLSTQFLVTADPGLTEPREGGALLVMAPGARSVDVGSLPTYTAAGGKARSFAPLRQEGVMWVGHQTWDQIRADMVRATGTDGRRTRIDATTRWSGASDDQPDWSGVAAPGSEPALLDCAQLRWGLERGLGDPQEVYAATQGTTGPAPQPSTPPTRDRPVSGSALTVMEAGDAYLVSGCVVAVDESARESFVVPVPAGGPEDLAALLPMSDSRTGRRWAVVAVPEGAASVEVAGVRVPVRNRFAVAELPAGAPVDTALRATVLRADGSVMATPGPAASDHELDRTYLDVLPARP